MAVNRRHGCYFFKWLTMALPPARAAQEAAQKQAAEHEALREQAREVQQQLDACRSAASSLAQQLQEAQQLHKDVSRVQAQLQIMQAELGGSTELGAPSEDGPAVPQPLAAADLAWLLKECSQNCKAVARLQVSTPSSYPYGSASLSPSPVRPCHIYLYTICT